MPRRQIIPYSLFFLCLAFFAIFLIWPIGLTLTGGFFDDDGFTFQYIIDVVRDPILRQGLYNALLIAIFTTLGCLIISLPLALVATRYDFPGKTALLGLLLVPLILPPFVGAIGLRALLGRYGAINSFLIDVGVVDPADPLNFLGGGRMVGVIIMEILHLYPIIYLNVSAAMANLDPALEQAAENLGAGRWTRFRRIIWPLIWPGVFAGATIVFIWSFTELGTPLMFDFTMVTPVQIFWGVQEADSPRPFALVVVTLFVAVACYLAGKWAFGGRAYNMTTRASTRAETIKLSFIPGLLAAAPFAIVTTLAILPHVGLVISSFSEQGAWYKSILPDAWTTNHYTTALTDRLASGSIQNSLIFAFLAMVIDIILGILIAYIVVRTKVIGRSVLDALSMMPLAVPGLVMAFGYVAMSRYLTDTWPGGAEEAPNWLQVTGQSPNPMVFLIIAYAVRRMPYVVRAAVAGLQQTPVDLEEAASVFGASKLYTVRRVVVPLISANLIAGGLLAFSFAMLEVSDSLILAQSEDYYPITKAIYTFFERLGNGPYLASAMGVWGMALLGVTLIGASILLGKKMGAIFRV